MTCFHVSYLIYLTLSYISQFKFYNDKLTAKINIVSIECCNHKPVYFYNFDN